MGTLRVVSSNYAARKCVFDWNNRQREGRGCSYGLSLGGSAKRWSDNGDGYLDDQEPLRRTERYFKNSSKYFLKASL